MSELHPNIKKLIRLAKHVPVGDTTSPLGFASRVVARSRAAEIRVNIISTRLFTATSWASVIVLLICGLILAENARTPKPATDFVTATHFLVKNLLP